MLTNDCVCCYLFSYPGSLFVSVLFCYITDSPTLSPFSTEFYPSQVETTPVSSIDSLVFCGFILSQVINFQWLFIAFYMRDLGVM